MLHVAFKINGQIIDQNQEYNSLPDTIPILIFTGGLHCSSCGSNAVEAIKG